MFATLAGGYPRPDLGPDATPDDLVRAVLADQEAAGLEILTDGHVRWDDRTTAFLGRLEGFDVTGPQPVATREPRWDGPVFRDAWRFAAGASQVPVKACVVGPYTLAARCAPGAVGRERLTMVLAEIVGLEVGALFQAGCPIVQIDEDEATAIGDSPREGQLFKSAHRRLTHDLKDRHLSLAVTGGSVEAVPMEVLFDAQYASYLLDLVSAPNNWSVVPRAQPNRGVVVGIVDARSDVPDDPDRVAWAATSAAALWNRGVDRVGVSTSGSLAGLTREVAQQKLNVLGEITRQTAARLAEDPTFLDPGALEREGRAHGWLPDDTNAAPAAAESA